MNFVALDWETANAHRSSACAVGLVTVADGVVVEEWGSLMQPPGRVTHVDPANTAVHGLSAADLVGAPPFSEVWPEIERRLVVAPVVAHNAVFDLGVVKDATGVAGLPCPPLDVGCTLVLARAHYDLPTYTLDAVAEVAGVRLDHHHEAVADAIAAAQILLAVARDLGTMTVTETFDAYRIGLGRACVPEPTPCRVRAEAVDDGPPTLF